MRAIAVILLASLIATASGEDLNLHMFLGTPQTVPPVEAFVPDVGDYPVPVTLEPDAQPMTLGIWAEVEADWATAEVDRWNGISVDFIASGCAEVLDCTIDNFDHDAGSGTAYRWESASDVGSPGGFDVLAVARYGLGGLVPSEPPFYGDPTDQWMYTQGEHLYYWLGNVTVGCNGSGEFGELYFAIGAAGIVSSSVHAGDRCMVHFGSNPPVRGDDFGAYGPIPMVVCVPEPAGAVLLYIAIAVLIRRR